MLRNERKRAAHASPKQVAPERITGDLSEGEAMVEVRLSSSDVDAASLTAVAKGLRRYFPSVALANNEYHSTPERIDKNSIRLNITRQFMTAPYKVSTRLGVTLSMWQSEGICRYAGISQNAYLILCALLGISQWSVLNSNPLLRLEDLMHPQASNCLFVRPDGIQNFALFLEKPRVCRGCVDFYHCLGADREVIALLDTLATLDRASDDSNRALGPRSDLA